MRYRCIIKYCIGDEVLMEPGDIITTEWYDSIYNVTKNKLWQDLTNIKSLKTFVSPIYEMDISEGFCSCTSTLRGPVDDFNDITNKMSDIFARKNHDYGNSFEESLNEEGLAASRIRLGDKWNRFKTLSKIDSTRKVKDESIRDTLLDMANYCIMTVMWLDKQNEDSCKD